MDKTPPEWLRHAPKEWRQEYLDAASVPIEGQVVDRTTGMVHLIIGDYLHCGSQWYQALSTKHGKTIARYGTTVAAPTCFECIAEAQRG